VYLRLDRVGATAGVKLWGGLLQLPANAEPMFAINFMLFGAPGQAIQQAVQAPALGAD
jgi:hypothetical protein